jgi:outer membrane protein TolC
MRKKIILNIFIAAFFFAIAANAQDIPQQYIDEALSNNLVLKEKKLSLEKSLVALKESKTLFLPTTWFEGQYTLAKGGRSIDMPIGDLLNPVYKSLNQLTGGHGFPQVANVSEQFLPNNFYDVRIKTTMPLINPSLSISRDIREQQSMLSQNEIDVYKRALVKEVKTAYYNYLMSVNAVSIYQNALEIVNQNLRANKALLKNGKGLPAYVSRAESEVKQVESQLLGSINEKSNAKAYFNFLLNKPLTDSITETELQLVDAQLPLLVENNVSSREELKSLEIGRSINQNVLKMNRSYRTPRLNAFVDLASQAQDFKVNDKTVFYLAGLQVQVPIFSGKRNLYKIEQSVIDGEVLKNNTEQVKQQLEVAAYVSHNSLTTAYTKYAAAIKQKEAAQNYFKLIDRGYKEGVNTFIEYLDARNQLTNAELQVNINKYKVFAAVADYERQTASYSFK